MGGAQNEIVLEEICTSFESCGCASQATTSKLGDIVQNTTKVAFETGSFVTTLQNEKLQQIMEP